MLALIQPIADMQMWFFFWIGIPALLISMLCILGFQYKAQLTLALSLVGFIALAGFIISLNLSGLISGETLAITKSGPTMVKKSEHAITYWLTTLVWFSAAFALLAFCLKKLVVILFQPQH